MAKSTKSIAFTEENLRERFHELDEEIKAIEKVSLPLREKRDAHVNKAREIENTMNEEIRKTEQNLFQLKSERGMIVRALKGRTEGNTHIAQTGEPLQKAEA